MSIDSKQSYNGLIPQSDGSWYDPLQRVTLSPHHSRSKEADAQKEADLQDELRHDRRIEQLKAPVEAQNEIRLEEARAREDQRERDAATVRSNYPDVMRRIAEIRDRVYRQLPEGASDEMAENILNRDPEYLQLAPVASMMVDFVSKNPGMVDLDWMAPAIQDVANNPGSTETAPQQFIADQAGAGSQGGESPGMRPTLPVPGIAQAWQWLSDQGSQQATAQQASVPLQFLSGIGAGLQGMQQEPQPSQSPVEQQPQSGYTPQEFPQLTAPTREGRIREARQQGTYEDRIADFRARGGKIDGQGRVIEAPPRKKEEISGSVAPNPLGPGEAGPNPGRGLTPLEQGFVQDSNGDWQPGSNIGGVPSLGVMQQLEANAARPEPAPNAPKFGTWQNADGNWTGMGASGNQGGFGTENEAQQWSIANFAGGSTPPANPSSPGAIAGTPSLIGVDPSNDPSKAVQSWFPQGGSSVPQTQKPPLFADLPDGSRPDGFTSGLDWMSSLRQGIQDRREQVYKAPEGQTGGPGGNLGNIFPWMNTQAVGPTTGVVSPPPVQGQQIQQPRVDGRQAANLLRSLRSNRPQPTRDDDYVTEVMRDRESEQRQDPSQAAPSWFPQGGSSIPQRTTQTRESGSRGSQAPSFFGAFSQPQQAATEPDYVTEVMREPQRQANPRQRQREPRLPALRAL